MSVLEELIPGIDYLWPCGRERLSIIQKGTRDYGQSVVEHYNMIHAFKDDDATMMALAAVAADERKRIDGLESKARLVLSMVGVFMAITLFVVGYLQVPDRTMEARWLVSCTFVISLIYLGIGLIIAAAGVQLSVRWFLDSNDLKQASDALQRVTKDVDAKALLAAASLAGRDLMARENLKKQNVIDIALRHMRNGIACLGVSILFALVMSCTGPLP